LQLVKETVVGKLSGVKKGIKKKEETKGGWVSHNHPTCVGAVKRKNGGWWGAGPGWNS